jgi:hypothetical protein
LRLVQSAKGLRQLIEVARRDVALRQCAGKLRCRLRSGGSATKRLGLIRRPGGALVDSAAEPCSVEFTHDDESLCLTPRREPIDGVQPLARLAFGARQHQEHDVVERRIGRVPRAGRRHRFVDFDNSHGTPSSAIEPRLERSQLTAGKPLMERD